MSSRMSKSEDAHPVIRRDDAQAGPTVDTSDDAQAGPPLPSADQPEAAVPAVMPKEIGGPPGPEPTRYGDWQYKGRVTDF